jgi:hypothetical protein
MMMMMMIIMMMRGWWKLYLRCEKPESDLLKRGPGNQQVCARSKYYTSF